MFVSINGHDTQTPFRRPSHAPCIGLRSFLISLCNVGTGIHYSNERREVKIFIPGRKLPSWDGQDTSCSREILGQSVRKVILLTSVAAKSKCTYNQYFQLGWRKLLDLPGKEGGHQATKRCREPHAPAFVADEPPMGWIGGLAPADTLPSIAA